MNKNPNGTARKEIVIRKISSNGENGWLGQVTKSSIELEDAAARFRELYDFAPNGYVSFDRSGRIVELLADVHQTRIFGHWLPSYHHTQSDVAGESGNRGRRA